MSSAFWHGFVSSDWNTSVQQDGSSNWGTKAPGASGASPTLVPDQVAEFPTNPIRTDITFSQNTVIATLLFDPGVPVYTFDLVKSLTISGAGVVNPVGNNSPIFMLPPIFGALKPLPVLTFMNQSSAGNAIIEGLPNALGMAGPLLFVNNSTAASATINRVETTFGNDSSAGSATINNIFWGQTLFRDHSSAGFSTITNSGRGGALFTDSSTAGHAKITNFDGGLTVFDSEDSTADHSTIINTGGRTLFQDGGQADHATIINRPSNDPNNPVTGITDFRRSDAGHASITNDGGLTTFQDGASADNATIINKNGGITQFEDDGNAGQAKITTFDASFVRFIDRSNGGTSSLVLESGGRLSFADESTAGSASIVNKAGGLVDLSGLTSTGMTAGSIEGDGTFRLGDSILVVGTNGLSTAVGGTIEDGGAEGGVGGGLVKVGSGTLKLTGANTYTGPTIIMNGTLELGPGGSLKSSVVFQLPVSSHSGLRAELAEAASSVLKLDLADSFSGIIDGFKSGGQIDLAFRDLAAGDHLSWLGSGDHSGGTLAYLDDAGTQVGSLNLTGWHSTKEFSLTDDGAGGTLIQSSQVSGTSTNDVFHAQGNVIYGGGGHDALIFAGLRADHHIEANNDGTFTIVSIGSPGGSVTTAFGIEFLTFTDKIIFIEDHDGASIARLYSAALGRAPDTGGLSGWEDIYANNISSAAKAGGVYVALAQTDDGFGSSIAGGFAQSPEFLAKYGALDDGGYVAQLYLNVLDRAPDTAELNAWLDLMHDGDFSRDMVLVGFAESPENIAKTADWLITV